MFESSPADTMCFPSAVKDADIWLPECRLPGQDFAGVTMELVYRFLQDSKHFRRQDNASQFR
ncbi:hypothetical protein Hanom_Chr03g00263491 [Helianthus anomalus]